MSQYEETLVEISPWKGEKERDAIIAHLTCSSLGLSCRKETILDGMQSPKPSWFMASSQEWYNCPTYMETGSKSHLLLRLCSNMEKRHVVSWTMCLYIISLSCLAWGPLPFWWWGKLPLHDCMHEQTEHSLKTRSQGLRIAPMSSLETILHYFPWQHQQTLQAYPHLLVTIHHSVAQPLWQI